MKFIAINGLVLISLAVYLFYHANYQAIDTAFFFVQMLELAMGAVKLILISMNIKSGLQLTRGMNNR